MANTGVPSEKKFDQHFRKLGGFVYAFEDAKQLFGKNKRAVANDAKPCDRMVVLKGTTFWAEIKSTENKTSFPFGIIKTDQLGYARQIIRADGQYLFFVHSLHLDKWFRIPAALVIERILYGTKSFKWTELQDMGVEIAVNG